METQILHLKPKISKHVLGRRVRKKTVGKSLELPQTGDQVVNIDTSQ